MAKSPPPPHATRRIRCLGCGFTIDIPVDCGDRFCGTCAPRRAFRVRSRLRWLLENTRPPPGYMLKMITLSMPNCKQLHTGVAALIKNFRRLRQRQIWKAHISGGATIIEVKGRPNNWHPHLHIICYARWIDWHRLQPAWLQISGGSACYISNIGRDAALSYVTKYITKSDVPEFLEYGVGLVLKRYRLFQRFGSWHGVVIPKKKFDYKCHNCGTSDWMPEWMLDRMIRAP